MFGELLFISGLAARIVSSLTVKELINKPDVFNEFKDMTVVGTVDKSETEDFLLEHFF